MNIGVLTLVLLAQLLAVAWSANNYDHCTQYAEYNTLSNLRKNDTCLNVDSVFKLLADITLKENSGGCRIHIITLLADHFGSQPSTPHKCQCQGTNKLQEYHVGQGDGVSELKNFCLNQQSYKNMYYHFFYDSRHSTDHVMACRTHHSVWSALRGLSTNGHGSNSCQKDIIFHLKYAFEHHNDSCMCTDVHTHTNGHQGHTDTDTDKCHHYNSFNKLLQLAETDGCLSANSVWHYLDDLQVQNKACRERIQKHLADKYKHVTSQDANLCTCHARRQLINHQIHRMENASFFDCNYHTSGTYREIEAAQFSNIRAHGCMNHDKLWTKLEGVHNFCSQHNNYNRHCIKWVDCTQDLIVRAAIQYPTDQSDSCVCSKVTSSSTPPATPASSTKAPTHAVTQTTTTSTQAPTTASTTKAPVPSVTIPTTRHPASATTTSTQAPTSASTTKAPMPSVTTSTTPPTTRQPASATSTKATQATTTVMSTQRTTPTLRFTCNKLAVVEDIAKSLKATHPDSSFCYPNAGGSDDAYVLSTCNMTSPMTWTKGANVLADCGSSTQLIPTYTPISTFDGYNYAPVGAQSGIFLGCYNTGIKIAIQKCNGTPEIVNIENGAFVNNPGNYYVIV